MKPDLRVAPAIEPEIGLHALLFLGRIWVQRLLAGAVFVGDFMLLGEPSAKIDQPATIAAEGSKLRGIGPLDVSPACGALNDRSHRL